MKTWFTADLHFGHTNLIKYCGRQIDGRAPVDVDEMDDYILDVINGVVGKKDRLYVIGDFSLRPLDQVAAYRKRIVCKNTVVLRGNHDHPQAHTVLGPMPSIKAVRWEGQKIVLCHYAMRTWPGRRPRLDRQERFRGEHAGRPSAWHLFGHSHGALSNCSVCTGESMDVGWDVFGRPVEAEEIKMIFDSRRADLERWRPLG